MIVRDLLPLLVHTYNTTLPLLSDHQHELTHVLYHKTETSDHQHESSHVLYHKIETGDYPPVDLRPNGYDQEKQEMCTIVPYVRKVHIVPIYSPICFEEKEE
ncbi:hypothetical protein TNCT_173911 [Trichonephila clavata]|uniref:Uncharacterized protein n=1 Tax=Trichonephila clavata TaxID=2740835 RepID=A0A8X6KWT2_TRICU|nr:hypothetical protein TNCT_173911 [Trichonephila clavata]